MITSKLCFDELHFYTTYRLNINVRNDVYNHVTLIKRGNR